MKYRPWGNVSRMLSLTAQKNWHLFGTIGTEDRSLCARDIIRDLGALSSETFIQINDVYSSKYSEKTHELIEQRRTDFTRNGGILNTIVEMELMAELYQIQKVSNQVLGAEASVILDITSMPKRFFFPILKALFNSDNISDLLITYTTPETYTPDSLYEDIDSWKNLPGFGGISTGSENLIVSIGFLVESLKNYFAGNPDHGTVKMLIPFPAPLSVIKRTWESVANIERERGTDAFEKYRVETLDISSAFDRIASLSNHPQSPIAFAPFGPKTTSVAMCLYAIQRDSAVYYPQPTVYHPEYSKGIRNNNPELAVNAYWIKHDGYSYYAV